MSGGWGLLFCHKEDGERVVKIVFNDFFWKGLHDVMKVT